MTPQTYVHGYSAHETERLEAQASTLAKMLHHATEYSAGAAVLEVGCGVGAQTMEILRLNPGVRLTSFDISAESVETARARVMHQLPDATVEWLRADLFDVPFRDHSFDHLLVCFVLEHLSKPIQALASLRRLLRPGGAITVIEGDHGSALFHPDSQPAHATIDCQIRLQRHAGGNALIGRRLQPLLREAGYDEVEVDPRTIYVDETRPELVDGFIRDTFTAMVRAARGDAVAQGLISETVWDRGIADLLRTADPGGTFLYTFFKASARTT